MIAASSHKHTGPAAVAEVAAAAAVRASFFIQQVVEAGTLHFPSSTSVHTQSDWKNSGKIWKTTLV